MRVRKVNKPSEPDVHVFVLPPFLSTRCGAATPAGAGTWRDKIARLQLQKKRRWILYLTGSPIKNVGDRRRG